MSKHSNTVRPRGVKKPVNFYTATSARERPLENRHCVVLGHVTDNMSGRKLSPEESKALFEERETWCAVARTKEEDWCRKMRQHYKRHLESHLFEDAAAPVSQPRCTFEIDAPTHRERRHFPPKHLISKWTTM